MHDPEYVNEILDRVRDQHPRIYGMLLYVEQPFPYELEEHQIDVHSVAARKPLFMDESAHDWHLIKLGRSLGWSGVALKTCKTQTGARYGLDGAGFIQSHAGTSATFTAGSPRRNHHGRGIQWHAILPGSIQT